MEKENKLTYLLIGRRALFSDPVTRVGGEKQSYHIPTYSALKGITESIYWKPSITWEVLRVRVLNPIQFESSGIRPIKYNKASGNELAYYTYLKDVAYEVEVKFVFNENRPDLKDDWNEHKHYSMAKRALEKGGRRDIFLGTRECQGYVMPSDFGDNESYYDDKGTIPYGFQFHSFIYPDEDKMQANELKVSFFNSTMKNGVITFPRPEETGYIRSVRSMGKKDFVIGENMQIQGGE